MGRTKQLLAICGSLVVFAFVATFGYGLLVNKSLNKSVPESKASSTVPTIPATSYSVPGGAIFMSTSGSDSNSGTQAAPVKTLIKALSLTSSGGTIVLRGGVYRDGSATSISKKITFQAFPGEQVWFDGTDVVSNWTSSGGKWYVDWNTPTYCKNKYYTFSTSDATY